MDNSTIIDKCLELYSNNIKELDFLFSHLEDVKEHKKEELNDNLQDIITKSSINYKPYYDDKNANLRFISDKMVQSPIMQGLDKYPFAYLIEIGNIIEGMIESNKMILEHDVFKVYGIILNDNNNNMGKLFNISSDLPATITGVDVLESDSYCLGGKKICFMQTLLNNISKSFEEMEKEIITNFEASINNKISTYEQEVLKKWTDPKYN